MPTIDGAQSAGRGLIPRGASACVSGEHSSSQSWFRPLARSRRPACYSISSPEDPVTPSPRHSWLRMVLRDLGDDGTLASRLRHRWGGGTFLGTGIFDAVGRLLSPPRAFSARPRHPPLMIRRWPSGVVNPRIVTNPRHACASLGSSQIRPPGPVYGARFLDADTPVPRHHCLVRLVELSIHPSIDGLPQRPRVPRAGRQVLDHTGELVDAGSSAASPVIVVRARSVARMPSAMRVSRSPAAMSTSRPAVTRFISIRCAASANTRCAASALGLSCS